MTIEKKVEMLEKEVEELRNQLRLVTDLAYYGYKGMKYSNYKELTIERQIKKFKTGGHENE